MTNDGKTGLVVHKGPRARPTIGFLTADVYSSTGQAIWGGVVDAARRHDVSLICFPGQDVRESGAFLTQANILYDLVSSEHLDGLLCWTSSVGRYLGVEQKLAFLQRYGLPVVGLTQHLPGIPTVLVDGRQGMRAAISHLIEVHGYRHLAFIRGPEQHPSAQERYQTYLDTLEAFEIPFDPGLVTPPGNWTPASGAEGIAVLLDERGLRPGSDLEAVVAVSDVVGLGMLETLQAREIQVPGEVALVGFNDSPEGRVTTPPLTSVAVPFHQQGTQGVEALLALLAGEEVPEQAALSAQLVVRQSCGCRSQALSQVVAGPPGTRRGKLEAVTKAQRDEMLSGMIRAAGGSSASLGPGWAGQLLDAFVTDLRAEASDGFVIALDDMLRQAAITGGDVAVWQDILSALRRSLLPYLDRDALVRAEVLWQQARVLIGEVIQRVLAYQVLQVEGQTQALHEVTQALLTTFDVGELMDELVERLSRLDIPSVYLSLYEDSDRPTEGARLVMAYTDEGRVGLDASDMRFPSPQLVPEGLWPDRSYSYVVKPLYFREHHIGLALFEVGPRKGRIYEMLRGEISSALYGNLLLQTRREAEAALEKAYAEVEQQVRERTVELEHEIEERERAQAESVRLQQEMIEAQQRAIQELSTPIIPVLEGVIIMPLIGSIDTLRARDVTRSLLTGIREHHARVVILDVTGVPVVDSGVANYLNKTVQAARLKGARTIVTGVSDAVAETIVDLGIDWSGIETLADLRTGLRVALQTRTQETR